MIVFALVTFEVLFEFVMSIFDLFLSLLQGNTCPVSPDRFQDGNYTWEDGLSLNISTTYTHWYNNFPHPIPGRTDCGFVANRKHIISLSVDKYYDNAYSYYYVSHANYYHHVSCSTNCSQAYNIVLVGLQNLYIYTIYSRIYNWQSLS